ncbi:hypothetical protein QL374_001206 [Salmonella enterica]|nr:hypothetical protein [Salmonella enterica]
MMSNYIAVVVKFEKIEGTDAIKPIEWAIYDIFSRKILPERYDFPRFAEEKIAVLDNIYNLVEEGLVDNLDAEKSRKDINSPTTL